MSMWVGVQVSAPQLTLLETVMARMERVDVWILMNGGGGGVNPFQVTQAHFAYMPRPTCMRFLCTLMHEDGLLTRLICT